MKNNKGFSLVELIVVLAIITIILTSLVPTFIRQIEKSRVSADLTDMEALEKVMEVMMIEQEVGNNKAPSGYSDGSGAYNFAYIAVFPKSKADSLGNTSKVRVDQRNEMSSELASIFVNYGIDPNSVYIRSKNAPWKNGYVVFLDFAKEKISIRILQKDIDCSSFSQSNAISKYDVKEFDYKSY